MDSLQVEEMLGRVLADVSRAFYLSMRILPHSCRLPISAGYLLARAADTLADNPCAEPAERLRDLSLWKSIVEGRASEEQRTDFWHHLKVYVLKAALKANPDLCFSEENVSGESLSSAVNALSSAAGSGVLAGISAGEAKLLIRLDEAYEIFKNLDEFSAAEVKKVACTLISGMEWDLQVFPGSFSKEEELERYTYLAAGCVGEFWTNISAHYLNAFAPEHKEEAVNIGIRFGKALQYTNILRDLPKDLQNGRSYIPCESLAQFLPDGHQVSQLESHRDALKPFILNALGHFRCALKYIQITPKRLLLLRLSEIWPVAIGLGTFAAMGKTKFWPSFQKRVKVSRRWIYGMIAVSIFLASSNTLLEYAFNAYERQIKKSFNL